METGPTRVTFQGAGVTLAADAYGAPGTPCVLLAHGGGQTRHSWGGTAALLATLGYHAITLDLRGHGDSDWAPDGNYELGAFATDLGLVVEQLDTTPMLVGASLGGLASMVAVAEAEHPDNVAVGLVLVDVAVHLESEGVDRIGAFMRGNPDGFANLDEVADAVAAYNPNRPRPTNLTGLRKNVRLGEDGRWRWHWDPRFMGHPDDDEPRVMRAPEQLEADARSLALPTLLVRGRESDLLSVDGAKKFLELVPHAEFVDVAGAGHMVAGDRNDAFNQRIVDFLSRVLPA